MLHFSCDICGKEMASGKARRFVVKMEVFAAHNPAEITEEDLDLDHLEAISELLSDETARGTEIAPTNQSFRYDLCPNCHAKFVNDPLNRETTQKFDFSPN
jgi:predicted RNA-binding Zn-ribbon protein involved in translation (DUF1610 family)